ncbi:MAG: membrane protein FxsA [Gemmatimonadota bacterium]|jgi:UPF0716 protein FxsA
MFARLALLFIVVPLLELALLIQVGQVVGVLPTVLLVLATGIAGAALARREGTRTLSALQQELGEGRLPGRALLDGLCVLVGGAFLLTPGILTDVAGFVLLLPPSRRWVQRWIRGRMERALEAGTLRVSASGPGGFQFWGGTFGGGLDATAGVGMREDGWDDELEGLDPRMEIDVREDGG